AALFMKAKNLRLRKIVDKTGGLERKIGEQNIKIVATQHGDAFRSDDGMLAVFNIDQRNIEGAAAQVVDEHALGGLRSALAMSVFNAGSGGFVEQSKDGEAGAMDRVNREKSL